MPPQLSPEDQLQNANQLANGLRYNAAFREFEIVLRRDYRNAGAHADFGVALLRAARFPAAVEQFRKAVELDPDRPVNVDQVFDALAHDPQQQEHAEDFQKTIDNADRAELFHAWARVLLQLKRTDRAIDNFKIALKKDPELELDAGDLAEAFKESTTTEEKVKEFQAEVDQLNNGHAYNTWGKTLLRLETYEAAAAQFEKSAAIRSDWAEPYVNCGRALLELGNHQNAIAVLKKALACDEHSAAAYFHLGKALHQIGEHKQAVSCYQTGAAKAPADDYFTPWLECMKELPDDDAAVAAYRKALEQSTVGSAEALQFAEFLKDRGRFDESAIHFARAISANSPYQTPAVPSFSTWFPAPGSFYDFQGYTERFRHARSQLEETLSDLANPNPVLDEIQKIFDKVNSTDRYIDWAKLLAKLDHVDRAKAQLPHTIPMYSTFGLPVDALKDLILAFKSPGDRLVAQNLIGDTVSKRNNSEFEVQWAGVLNDLNQHERALALYRQVLLRTPQTNGLTESFAAALQTSPPNQPPSRNDVGPAKDSDDAEVYYRWALILIKLGQVKEAIDALLQALRLDPNHGGAHYELARLYEQQGHYKKACRHFQEANSMQQFPDALQDWAKTLLKNGQREEAIEKYLDAFRQGGTLDRVRQELSWDDELLGRFQKVVDETNSAESYLQWGSFLRTLKRHDLAIQQLKHAVDLDPDRLEVYSEWLKALGASGLPAAGLQEYEASLLQYRNNSDAFREFGDFLYNLKHIDLAEEKYRTALQRDPKDVYARLMVINCRIVANDVNQARQEARALLVDDPANGSAYNCLSWGAYLDGDFEESRKQAELGVEKSDLLYLHNRIAWALYKSGQEDLARKKFDDIIAARARNGYPPDYDTHYQYGLLLMEMGRGEDAAAEFRKVVALKPDHVYANHNLAAIPYDQGRYEDAWEKLMHAIHIYAQQQPFLTRAIDNNEAVDSYEAFYHAALILNVQPNKYEEAESVLKKGLDFDPYHTGILRMLAELNWQKKEEEFVGPEADCSRQKSTCYWQGMEYFQRAERLLKEQVDRYPNYYLLFELADLYMVREDYDKARQYFEAARARDEKMAGPHAKLGVISLREGQPEKAIPLFKEALKRNPDDLDTRSSLAEAYLRAQKFDDADATYRSVLNVAPNHVQSYIGLGELYLELGKKDSDAYSETIDYFTKALNIADNEKIRSKHLKRQEKAAVYYQLGYARVQVYEGYGIRKDIKLLEQALKDFVKCVSLNPSHQQARRAKERIEKRLEYFSRDRLTQTWGPMTIVVMSMLVFVLVQAFFFGVPFFNKPSLIVSDKTVQAAAEQKAAPEALQGLEKLKNQEFPNREALANAVKGLFPTDTDKLTKAVLQNAESVKPLGDFDLGGGYYALLTFGTLLFVVVGLYLPQLLKLRVAGIELEKSVVDQAATEGTLGISKSEPVLSGSRTGR